MEAFHRQVCPIIRDFLAKLIMIRMLRLRVYFLLQRLRNAVENYVTWLRYAALK